jgi:hypothetical protein
MQSVEQGWRATPSARYGRRDPRWEQPAWPDRRAVAHRRPEAHPPRSSRGRVLPGNTGRRGPGSELALVSPTLDLAASTRRPWVGSCFIKNQHTMTISASSSRPKAASAELQPDTVRSFVIAPVADMLAVAASDAGPPGPPLVAVDALVQAAAACAACPDNRPLARVTWVWSAGSSLGSLVSSTHSRNGMSQ